MNLQLFQLGSLGQSQLVQQTAFNLKI
uniref:Uncharacterized protein n=1 Tax=Tetranychus urticae TaxID=32264 RepID=T1KWN2_TETUR